MRFRPGRLTADPDLLALLQRLVTANNDAFARGEPFDNLHAVVEIQPGFYHALLDRVTIIVHRGHPYDGATVRVAPEMRGTAQRRCCE